MAKNNGIDNAQLVQMNQNDNAISAHTKGDVFSTGTVGSPLTVADGHEMWFGTGNAPTNYNTTTDGTIEAGLKMHVRNGADILPSGSGANGEQTYNAPAGEQSATRAAWNLDYAVTTAANNDLAGTPNLNAEDFKMQIVASGPGFISPQTAVFDLNPTTHVWTDEENPSVGFGGDDFSQPGASASLQAHVAENSLNIDFILGGLGGVTLNQATMAGNSYDVKLVSFSAGTPHMDVFTHDVINLVATT